MKRIRVWLMCAFAFFCIGVHAASVTIREYGGWFESGYVIWELVDGASSYQVYCRALGGEYVLLDTPLIRNYGDYGRADALGLSAGEYQFKVMALDAEGKELTNGTVESDVFTVRAHDRAGFAHLNYSGVGAYGDDGRLKDNAKVLYVTSETAKTVTCDVVTKSNGTAQTFIGLQTILDARQKGYDKTPLAIRLIGTIEDSDMDKFSSSSEGLQIKGKNVASEMNITLEGVGCDAAIRGFGILLRNCRSVELRNFAVMLCMDDCISIDSDNSNCWVHNVDFFYGQTGGDSDQAKGDGSLDCKGDSKYMTFSYNHFWDCGKMALCGMTSETGENFISYHHNWFDHSDSRHPRVRTMTVHVYNNYFDGVSKYGVGATSGSNVFVESNYFRNTNRPMLISLQGTDISGDGKGTFSGENGGMIKSYGNVYAEKSTNFRLVTHKESATAFDCYEATTREEQVPSTYVTLVGKTAYNNFDTDLSKMYAYTADSANDIPAIVTGQYGAGRMQHGDFKWVFNNVIDDVDYEVNSALKESIIAYTPSLIGFWGKNNENGDDNIDNGEEDDSGNDTEKEDTPSLPIDGDYICHFTGRTPSNPFYSISGNYSNSKGQATVNGVTYTDCLKIESSTSIRFTITEKMMLTLVFAEGTTPNIKVDGEKITSESGNIITVELEPGAHEITKANTYNLFYINLVSTASSIHSLKINTIDEDAPYYDLSGRPVKKLRKGQIYIQKGVKILKK